MRGRKPVRNSLGSPIHRDALGTDDFVVRPMSGSEYAADPEQHDDCNQQLANEHVVIVAVKSHNAIDNALKAV